MVRGAVRVTSPLHLLVLASAPPYPMTDGGRIAIFEPLQRLAGRGHSIDLLTFGDPAAVPEPLRQACGGVVLVPERPDRGLWKKRLASPFRRPPYLTTVYASQGMNAALRRQLATRRYDLVVLETLSMASYLPVVREYGLPVVLRAQNVESVLCAGQAEMARGLRRRHYRLQVPKLR